MRRYLLAGFLVLGLLLLGCTGQQGGGTGTGGTGTGGGGGGGTGGGGTGGLDLAGLGYAQLMALGVPVECTVTQSDNGVVTQLTLKIKGDKVRGVGTTTQGGVTTSTEFIAVGDTTYVRIPDEQAGAMGTCQWLKIVSNESADTEVNGMDVTPQATLESASAQYSCVPGTFGDDVFSAPASGVCDLNAMINGMTGGNGEGMPDPCDQVSDDAQREACRAACGSVADYIERVQCAANYMATG